MQTPDPDVRAAEDSTEAQVEQFHSPEPATVTAARMVANPRRIRRD